MRGSVVVVVRNSLASLIFGLLIALVNVAPSLAVDTTVGALICAPSSTITLTAPVSDSVVSTANVSLSGSVTQANQINVLVDGAFNSVITVGAGQTTYSGSVELSPGTHTIMVEAVNVCLATNGSASSTVTYSPPPTIPSNGTTTPTKVGGVIIQKPSAPSASKEIGGSPVSAVADGASSMIGSATAGALKAVENTFEWLGIDVGVGKGGRAMGVSRAFVVSFGLYLMVFGMIDWVVRRLAMWQLIAGLWGVSPVSRVKWIAWGFRGAGLLLILGALFI